MLFSKLNIFIFFAIVVHNSQILMKHFQNVSNFYVKDQNTLKLIPNLPVISQKNIADFSDNDFREIRKQLDKQKLETRKNPY